MFINFVQKFEFERSQFQEVGMALTEFYLFELSLFQVLGESCFKAPKVPLDECFYH